MSQRQIIYESEHLQALSNERGLVLVFKGEPAVVSNHDISHAALMRVTKAGPGVSLPSIRAVAILRGRGVFIQYVNPNPHYMTYVNPGDMITGQFVQDGYQQYAPVTQRLLTLWPGQTKWVASMAQLHSLIRPYGRTVQAPAGPAAPIQAGDAVGIAGMQYFVSASTVSSIEYVETEVGRAIDLYHKLLSHGYQGSYIRVAPTDKGVEINEIMDCMSERIAPRVAPTEYNTLGPMSLNDYADKLKDPRWRRLMRKGGMTDLVEYITGTRSKQMMKMLAPTLFRQSSYQHSSSSFTLTSAVSSYSAGMYLVAWYFEMSKILRSMSVDHAIRFVKLYLRSQALPMNGVGIGNYSAGANYFDSIQEFFTVGDHTKILNKIEYELDNYECSIGMRPDEAVAAGYVRTDPFSAMHDAGAQLLRWRNTKLNKRQEKFFPNGIVLKKWQSITEIHDDISKQANKLEALGQLVHMPWAEDVMQLHGVKCGEVTLLLPRTNMALVRWGKAQGHCVGSMYNLQMQRGQVQIVGAFIGGKIAYCIRLNRLTALGAMPDPNAKTPPWTLSEFRGQGNCWPTAAHAAAVLDMLNEAGVLTRGWAESQNGYGRSKDGNWDADLAQLQMAKQDISKPSIRVRNWTPINPPKPETEKLIALGGHL